MEVPLYEAVEVCMGHHILWTNALSWSPLTTVWEHLVKTRLSLLLIFQTLTELKYSGFLTTNDGVIPGNLGLKDALLALKWTRENIEYFRGDRDLITINGISAGAASVSHFIASPAAKGKLMRIKIVGLSTPVVL